jgi:hypothetical protein
MGAKLLIVGDAKPAPLGERAFHCNEIAPMGKDPPYFPTAAFDPDMTHIMGQAFDRACQGLYDVGQPDIVKEVIASRIIDAARDGERDPGRLCRLALRSLGFKSEPGFWVLALISKWVR